MSGLYVIRVPENGPIPAEVERVEQILATEETLWGPGTSTRRVYTLLVRCSVQPEGAKQT